MERTRANLKRALMDSDVRSKVMKRDILYMSYITVRSAKHAKAVVGFASASDPGRGGAATAFSRLQRSSQTHDTQHVHAWQPIFGATSVVSSV